MLFQSLCFDMAVNSCSEGVMSKKFVEIVFSAGELVRRGPARDEGGA